MNKTAANVQRSPKEMEELIRKLKIEVQALKSQLLELGVAPKAPGKDLKLEEATPSEANPLSSGAPSTKAST